MEIIIQAILMLAALYLSFGLLFAVFFLTSGIHKIDDGAHGSSFTFRLIIAPGVVVFWIVLLKKIIAQKRI
jgi:uncharacterized membrane protein YphA (DoxX/SURF4 family)